MTGRILVVVLRPPKALLTGPERKEEESGHSGVFLQDTRGVTAESGMAVSEGKPHWCLDFIAIFSLL